MFIIDAKIRKKCGRSANRRLRAMNKFPAVIYTGTDNPILIELDHNKLWNIQYKIEFYQNILIILFDDNKREYVKVQCVHRHAYKARLNHIDFIRQSQ